jgi:RNA polymerase sigma factor (sigma-70 family)
VAAVPSIGRASRVVGNPAPEADATRTLYEQYANQIFRYCLHQLGSREEAEDAVQSTFLNAFRGLKRGVVPELESAWLFKIAHNVCLSRRRSSWRRGRVESPHDFELVEEFASAPSRQGEELIGLQDVLEGMPENQRRAILLREWQGLSYREIAEELELSQAAVETLIFRARRSLAQGLEQAPVEQRSWRKRIRSALDFGGAVGGLQGWLAGGGAAVKVGAAVVAVTATSVVAASPVTPSHHVRHVPAPAPPAVQHASPNAAFLRTASVPQSVAAQDVRTAVHWSAIVPPARSARPHAPISRSSHPVAVAPTGSASPDQPVASTPAPADPQPQQASPGPAATDPPGQAKQNEQPAASHGSEHGATPPGQAKKAAPAQPATAPPGQAPPSGGKDNHGQDKKDAPAPAQQPPAQDRPAPPPPAAASQPSGKDGAPGQVKKDAIPIGSVAPPPPAPPAPPILAPSASAPPAPQPQPPAADDGHGDGGGNGHGNGHGGHP